MTASEKAWFNNALVGWADTCFINACCNLEVSVLAVVRMNEELSNDVSMDLCETSIRHHSLSIRGASS